MLENFRTQAVTWDLARKRIYETIQAHQGDSNGRKLVVQVINEFTVENLTGSSLSLAWQGNDAKGLDAFKVVDATKGVFEIEYTTEMLSNTGVLKASIVLVSANGRIESEPFTIKVQRSLVDDESVQSENSFTALTTALLTVSKYDSRISGVENEIILARGRAQTLGERLDSEKAEVSAQLQQKAPKNEVAMKSDLDITNSQISNIVASGTITEGNTELIDTRVGADGVTYNTAGEAVRENDLAIKRMIISGEKDTELLFEQGVIDSAGDDVESTQRIRSVGYYDTSVPTKIEVNDGYTCNVIYYNSNYSRRDSSGFSEGYFEVENTYPYCRFLIGKVDISNIVPEEATHVKFITSNDGYYDNKINEVNNDLTSSKDVIHKELYDIKHNFNSESFTPEKLTWENGSITSWGELQPNSGILRNAELIPIERYAEITIKPKINSRYILTTWENGNIKLHTGWLEEEKTFINTMGDSYRLMISTSGNNPIDPVDSPSVVERIKISTPKKDAAGYYDLGGKTIITNTPPKTGKYKNGLFKVNELNYPTPDWFEVDETKRITHNYHYSSWAQDKCFIHDDVVYALYNEGPGHGVDGTIVMMAKSYDYGDSWTEPEVFYDLNGYAQVVCFGAGADENGIYTIIRRRNGRYMVGETDYIFYYKLKGDENWSSKPLDYHEGDYVPINYHAFEKLPDGSLSFGYFMPTEEGLDDGTHSSTGIIKSFDLFDTYETHQITSLINGDVDCLEPTMCTVGDVVYGSLRTTTTGQPHIFWESHDNCQTFTLSNFPTYVSVGQSNIPLELVNGKLVSLMIERNSDGKMVYAEADIEDLATQGVDAFRYYHIGNVTPLGMGGSGVPSGVVVNNSVIWIYSSDEAKFENMPNMFSTKMHVQSGKSKYGLMDVFSKI